MIPNERRNAIKIIDKYPYGIIKNRKHFISVPIKAYLILDSLFLKKRLNYGTSVI